MSSTKYINVEHGGLTKKLPIGEDNKLGLPTLTSLFPGATNLEFKDDNGNLFTLEVDPYGAKLKPPLDADGWNKEVFFVVYPQPVRKPSPNLQDVPKYIPIEVNDLIRQLDQYLFYEEFGNEKFCFTIISPHFAVSFNHACHKNWCSGPDENQTKVIIYNQKGEKFETKVVECNAELDFIVVESEKPLVEKAPEIKFPCKLERYILLGYPYADNPDKDYQALEGIFSSVEYDNEGRLRGSSGSLIGYSGGPIFNYKGQLLGINVANESLVLNTENEMRVQQYVTFPSLSVIVPAYFMAANPKYHGDCKFD